MDVVPFDEGRESLDEMTELLHRAYAPLEAAGMNYVAASQSSDITRRRVERASACWVARDDGALVGTIAYYTFAPADRAPVWYSDPSVGHFAQFAVDPKAQRRGIGSALLLVAERHAAGDGKAEIACDTALPATHLIAYYERRGFRRIGRHRWPHALYTSVVLSKRLAPS